MIALEMSGKVLGVGSSAMLAEVEMMGRPKARTSGGTGDVREEVPGNQGDFLHIHREPFRGIEKDNHTFPLVALLDAVNAGHGLFIGRVATDTPHCISRIGNDFTLQEQLCAFLNFLFHKSQF